MVGCAASAAPSLVQPRRVSPLRRAEVIRAGARRAPRHGARHAAPVLVEGGGRSPPASRVSPRVVDGGVGALASLGRRVVLLAATRRAFGAPRGSAGPRARRHRLRRPRASRRSPDVRGRERGLETTAPLAHPPPGARPRPPTPERQAAREGWRPGPRARRRFDALPASLSPARRPVQGPHASDRRPLRARPRRVRGARPLARRRRRRAPPRHPPHPALANPPARTQDVRVQTHPSESASDRRPDRRIETTTGRTPYQIVRRVRRTRTQRANVRPRATTRRGPRLVLRGEIRRQGGSRRRRETKHFEDFEVGFEDVEDVGAAGATRGEGVPVQRVRRDWA